LAARVNAKSPVKVGIKKAKTDKPEA
jgi:hypothetical protein